MTPRFFYQNGDTNAINVRGPGQYATTIICHSNKTKDVAAYNAIFQQFLEAVRENMPIVLLNDEEIEDLEKKGWVEISMPFWFRLKMMAYHKVFTSDYGTDYWADLLNMDYEEFYYLFDPASPVMNVDIMQTILSHFGIHLIVATFTEEKAPMSTPEKVSHLKLVTE